MNIKKILILFQEVTKNYFIKTKLFIEKKNYFFKTKLT